MVEHDNAPSTNVEKSKHNSEPDHSKKVNAAVEVSAPIADQVFQDNVTHSTFMYTTSSIPTVKPKASSNTHTNSTIESSKGVTAGENVCSLKEGASKNLHFILTEPATAANTRGPKLKLPLNRKAENDAQDSGASLFLESSNFELIIERSKDLCDRWQNLGLGKLTGTVALNEYIQQKGLAKNNESPFTASEMLHTFETLRPTIKPLPPTSEVRKIMKKSDTGEGYVLKDNYKKAKETANDQTRSPFPTESIAKLYQFMSTQPNYQIYKRRKLHRLDGDQIVEKLKSYENRICDLEQREDKVMKSFME